MAKLFYTIDEAASKLGKSADALIKMVSAGQLEEFKMHDQVHFKRAVIDQLVVDDGLGLDLSLNDDLSISDSGSPIGASPNDSSGSAMIDDLKFDDDPLTGSGQGPADEVELDLNDGLSLHDSSAESPAIMAPASHAPAPSLIPVNPPIDPLDDILGLADSADDSAIGNTAASATPSSPPAPVSGTPTARSALDLDLGPDGGLDLGLDLGLDDSSAQPSVKATAPQIDLGDSRGGSAIGSADASGSNAPAVPRRPAPAEDDFLDSGSMTGSGELTLETVGSGSGMLDQSNDPDQSSIGAGLLDDGGEDTFATGLGAVGSTGLFAEPAALDGFEASEPTAAPMSVSATGFTPALAERVDSASSGLGLGLLIAAAIALVLITVVVVGSRTGGGSELATTISKDLLIWGGGLLGASLLCGGIGYFVGRSLE